jgi:hypothetical protein
MVLVLLDDNVDDVEKLLVGDKSVVRYHFLSNSEGYLCDLVLFVVRQELHVTHVIQDVLKTGERTAWLINNEFSYRFKLLVFLLYSKLA